MAGSLDINLSLTPMQLKILQDNHRFKVLCIGRQSGKSHLAACMVIMKALQKPNSVIWLISPVYRQSGYMFDKIVTLCKDNNIPISTKRSNQDMVITFSITGSKFQALSGDDGDKLRGQTLDYLILDEAAMLNDEIWSKYLRPMTAVFRSEVLFLSTPKGKNWFYDIYKLGLEDSPEWKSFQATSYDGIICAHDKPDDHPGKDELDKIKSETDDLTWRQEYLAEFLDSGGVVFTSYTPAHYSDDIEIEDGAVYFVSIDLAKHSDYTVLFVANVETNEIVYYWRATGLSWESQMDRFLEISKRYHNPTFFVDSTGLGDTIVERMIEEGLDTRGIVFSSKSKQQMVQNLAVMLQRKELLPPDVKEVLDELDRYTFEHTSTGQFRYSAPDGYHDDCVSSLMILAWALSKVPSDIGFVTDDELNGIKTEKKSNEIGDISWESDYDKISWDISDYSLE